MQLLVSKICSAILLAALRLIAGLLPLKVYRKLSKWGRRGDKMDQPNKRRKRIDLFLSAFLCFGAGLLLSTCFIHMIPEVRDSFETAARSGQWPILDQFPFAEGVVCMGFFAVYLFEELGERLVTENKVSDKKASKKPPVPERAAQGTENGNGIVPDKNGDNSPSKDIALRSEGLLNREDKTHRSDVAIAQLEDGIRSEDEEHGHSHEHGHGHSHGPSLNDLEQKSVAAAIRGFLLVFALSFHSIFEGMAIGLQPNVRDVWFLFAAVTVHELAIMFCIGLEMLTSKIRIVIYVVYMVTLGFITPLGVVIGILVTEYVTDPSASHTLVIAILQGIAAGTLLYVTFMEVLERERKKPGNGLIKYVSVLTGFVLLSLMEAIGGHGDPAADAVATDGSAAILEFQSVQHTTPLNPFFSFNNN